MSDDRVYLATTATFPGYWGKHADGHHHAIAECCSEGAARDGVFVVYLVHKEAYMDGFGNLCRPEGSAEPELDGVYDAAGFTLGENLTDAADRARDDWWGTDDTALGAKALKALKEHKA